MRHSLSGQIINWAGWFLRSAAPNPKNIVTSCPLEFWFDGQDAATLALNGNKVIQWDDKSGFDRHVANAVDAQRPTYSAVTGRLTFIDANLNYLQIANFTAPLAQPNTIYILYKITGVLADTEIVFDSGLVRHWIYYQGNTFRLRTSAILAHGGATDANDNIHAGEFNGVASNYWINGILTAGDAGITALDGITIGANAGMTNSCDAEIMEVFGYNCLLTPAERTALDAYLTSKWGL